MVKMYMSVITLHISVVLWTAELITTNVPTWEMVHGHSSGNTIATLMLIVDIVMLFSH